MPEGDTIHRLARKLHTAAADQRVVRFCAWDPRLDRPSLVDRTLLSVESRGKHLLMHFDQGPSLHTHMMMKGKWQVRAPNDAPSRATGVQRLLLQLERACLVCVNVQVARWVDLERLAQDDWLRRLGPDLLSPNFDVAVALQRLQRLGPLQLGEALIHQGAVCGIGNVFKSETLFLQGLNPFALVAQTNTEQLAALIDRNRVALQRNSGPGRRTLRFSSGGPRLWVYGRNGEHCLRCSATVQMRRQGEQLRSTYFCPECQGVA